MFLFCFILIYDVFLWVRKSNCSDEIFISIEIISSDIFIHVVIHDFVDIKMIPKSATNTSKTFYKLESFLSFVTNKFNLSTIMLIIDTKPVTKWFWGNYFKVNTTFLIFKVFWVFFLLWVEVPCFYLIGKWIFDFISHDFNFIKDHNNLNSRCF